MYCGGQAACNVEPIRGSGGYRHAYFPVELDPATGRSELGKVRGCTSAFRPSGSRSQVALSSRLYTLRAFILSATSWAVAR